MAQARAILVSAYFTELFHRLRGCQILRLRRQSYSKPMLCSVAALTLMFVARLRRILSWAGLASIGLLFGGGYSVLISVAARSFEAHDRNKIEALVLVVGPARRLISIA